MRHIDTISEFLDLAGKIEFGRLEDVTFDIEESDVGLRKSYRPPMNEFVDFLRRKKGSVTFTVLKIQNGLPMHGETEIMSGVYQNHRFA